MVNVSAKLYRVNTKVVMFVICNHYFTSQTGMLM